MGRNEETYAPTQLADGRCVGDTVRSHACLRAHAARSRRLAGVDRQVHEEVVAEDRVHGVVAEEGSRGGLPGEGSSS